MYVIVEVAGKQFKVTQDQQLCIPRLDVTAGSSVTFDKVLLVAHDDGIAVGTPMVADAKVSGKVLAHFRGDTIVVFKKKRRKGYKKTQGHRQDYTKVLIERIIT